MKKQLTFFLVLIYLISMLNVNVFAQNEENYAVWVSANCEKVLRDQKPPEQPILQMELEAARNEYEGGQIIIRAGASDLTNVNVSVTDLVYGQTRIPADQISISRQHYMHITEPTTDFPEGWYPDALIPLKGANSTFNVAKGQNQGVWITVKVPKDIPAGLYEGTLKITGDNINENVPARLTVWDFELTDTSHSKTAFATWWGQLPFGHPDISQGTPEFEELLKNYYSFFLDYRISSTDLPVSEANADEYVSGVEKYLSDPRVTAYRIPYYGNADKTKELVGKLRDKGLLNKGYFYIIDEPTSGMFDSINGTGKTIKSFDPNVKHLVTMDINDAVSSSVNLWCTILTSWTGEYPQIAREFQQKGDEVWWYTCVNPKKPFPSYHIDDHLTGARMLSWMQKSYNVEGNLYWAVNIYQKYDLEKGYISRDIWNDPKAFPGANGDGYLVYPGAAYGINGPISTIRLETIREGNEDYEYLWLLEKRMKEAAAALGIADFNTEEAMKPYFDRLFSSVKSYNTDPKNLIEIRREVAQEIINLGKSPKYLVKIGAPLENGTKLAVYVESGSTVKINDVTAEVYGNKAEATLITPVGINTVKIEVTKDADTSSIVKSFMVKKPEVETYPVKINYMEKVDDVKKWECENTKAVMSDRFSSQGIYSMQVTYDQGVDWPNVRLSHDNGGLAITDWSGYKTFDFDVYNEEEGFTAQIYVKFFDKDGNSYDRNWFNILSKRKSHISIPISEIGLDVSKIGMVEIWMFKASQTVTLHFDNFVLRKEKDASNVQYPVWSADKELIASNITTSGVHLNWIGAGNDGTIDTYEIYMNGKLLDSVDSSVHEYSVNGLEHNTDYTFKVEARNSFGNTSSDGPAANMKTLNDEVILSFPVISDIHLGTDIKHDSAARFDKALKDVKGINPSYDAMVVVGDLTSLGLDEEYDTMLQVLKNNEHAPVYYTLGNHEYWKARMNGWNLDDSTFPNGETEEMTHNRFTDKTGMSGIYYDKWISGKGGEEYHFIFLSPEKFWQTDKAIGDKAYISDEQIAWLEAKMAERADEKKPIFVFVHQPLQNTVPESFPGNSIIQSSKVKKALAKYPQAMLFTGHTHYDLNSPGNMLQQYFTMFNTSSAYYVLDWENHPERSQGLYVDVYKDKVVVRSREFSNQSWINGGKYRVFLPLDLPKMDTEEPTWPANSNIEVTEAKAKSVALKWTPAADNTGVTAYRIFKNGIPAMTVKDGSTSATVKGLEPETTYEFAVEALDKDDNISTGGPRVTATTLEYTGGGNPVISLSQNKVLKGDKIEVTFSNLPEELNSNDWIGLYEEKDNPGGGVGSMWWAYLPSMDINGKGGTFTFDLGSTSVAAGKSYKLVLFYNDSYNVEAYATFKVCDIIASATVDNKTGIVAISGKTSIGEGKQISAVVKNPAGAVDYNGKMAAGEDGSFKFEYTLDKTVKGTYKVYVDGDGVKTPAELEFAYEPNKDPTNPPPVNPPAAKPDTGKEPVIENGNVPRVSIKAEPGKDKETAVVSVGTDLLSKLFSGAKESLDGIKKVVVEILEVKDVNGYSVRFQASDLSKTEGINRQIDLKTPAADVVIPGNMLSATDLSGSSEVSIKIGAADKSILDENIKKQVGDRPVVELNLTIDGKVIRWENPDAPVAISLKYKPSEEELKDPEHIVVWYIDGSGKAVAVPSGRYDEKTGMVTFTTTHFSKYAVAYVNKTFSDIADIKWARKEIEVLAAKGIVDGTSDTAYSPVSNITRADFIVYLVRALNLDARVDSNFSDVKKDQYYYKEVGIAKKLGIVAGNGKNKFAPDKPISRQDMMVITARALSIAKNETVKGSHEDLKGYKDTSGIASYAADSVAAMVKKGIIKGNNHNINPKGSVTRAQAAVVIYKLYNM